MKKKIYKYIKNPDKLNNLEHRETFRKLSKLKDPIFFLQEIEKQYGGALGERITNKLTKTTRGWTGRSRNTTTVEKEKECISVMKGIYQNGQCYCPLNYRYKAGYTSKGKCVPDTKKVLEREDVSKGLDKKQSYTDKLKGMSFEKAKKGIGKKKIFGKSGSATERKESIEFLKKFGIYFENSSYLDCPCEVTRNCKDDELHNIQQYFHENLDEIKDNPIQYKNNKLNNLLEIFKNLKDKENRTLFSDEFDKKVSMYAFKDKDILCGNSNKCIINNEEEETKIQRRENKYKSVLEKLGNVNEYINTKIQGIFDSLGPDKIKNYIRSEIYKDYMEYSVVYSQEDISTLVDNINCENFEDFKELFYIKFLDTIKNGVTNNIEKINKPGLSKNEIDQQKRSVVCHFSTLENILSKLNICKLLKQVYDLKAKYYEQAAIKKKSSFEKLIGKKKFDELFAHWKNSINTEKKGGGNRDNGDDVIDLILFICIIALVIIICFTSFWGFLFCLAVFIGYELYSALDGDNSSSNKRYPITNSYNLLPLTQQPQIQYVQQPQVQYVQPIQYTQIHPQQLQLQYIKS